MQVRLKNSNRIFDVPRDIAQALMLAPGCVIEEVPPDPPFKPGPPDTTWKVAYVGLTASLLAIVASCATCKQTLTMAGPEVAKSGNKFWHCGVGESIPKNVAKRYEQLRRQSEPQQRPEQPGLAAQRLYGATGETEYVGSNPNKEE